MNRKKRTLRGERIKKFQKYYEHEKSGDRFQAASFTLLIIFLKQIEKN